MRPRSAAILACRIIALFFGIQALLMTVSLLAFAVGPGSGRIWATVGATAIVAWGLWMPAENLSGAMTRGAPDEAPASPRSTANAHAVAFSIVGVVLIVQAIPGLVAIAASDVPGFAGGLSPFGLSGGSFFSGRGAAVATEVVRIVLGFVLIYGAGDLARSLSRRYPDPERSPPPAERP
jgi:hypothetical protein